MEPYPSLSARARIHSVHEYASTHSVFLRCISALRFVEHIREVFDLTRLCSGGPSWLPFQGHYSFVDSREAWHQNIVLCLCSCVLRTHSHCHTRRWHTDIPRDATRHPPRATVDPPIDNPDLISQYALYPLVVGLITRHPD